MVFKLPVVQCNMLIILFWKYSELKCGVLLWCLTTAYLDNWNSSVSLPLLGPSSLVFEDLSGPDTPWVYQRTLLNWYIFFFFDQHQHPQMFVCFLTFFHFNSLTSHPQWFWCLLAVVSLESLMCLFNLFSFSFQKHLLFPLSVFMVSSWRLSRCVCTTKITCVDFIIEKSQQQYVTLLIENPCADEKTALRWLSFFISLKGHLAFSGKHVLRIGSKG